jgi:hypothetical protein
LGEEGRGYVRGNLEEGGGWEIRKVRWREDNMRVRESRRSKERYEVYDRREGRIEMEKIRREV